LTISSDYYTRYIRHASQKAFDGKSNDERIDAEFRGRFSKLAGRKRKMQVRWQEIMKEKEISTYVDDLWNRIGRKLKSREVRPKDIGRAIKVARKGRARDSI
jgi:hypothetical protein